MQAVPPPQPPADAFTASSPPAPPAPASCWSAVLQKKPEAAPASQEAVSNKVFESCTSTKGIAVAVIDANALIHGDKLAGYADKFVSVPEIFDEVRDPVSRRRISFLPFQVDTVDPSPEFIKKVVKFARQTGDLQTLSDVDIKLIALTYMLEAQAHGTDHLRESPPQLQMVNVKNLGETEMPGWGSNVPNLAEWDALDQSPEEGYYNDSRILSLKELNDKVIPDAESGSKLEEHNKGHQFSHGPRRAFPPKKEVNLEGKKMVANGIDASQGQDTENPDDWQPAVSRSTHRRYLRRKSKRESNMALEENSQVSVNGSTGVVVSDGDGAHSDAEAEGTSFQEDLSASHYLVGEGVEDSNPSDVQEDSTEYLVGTEAESNQFHGVELGICAKELDNLEISCPSDSSHDTTYMDDINSEQSWMLRSLSDSSVACVTSDYAMQNVVLQIGLRLLAPGGMQIRRLHRWVLKCHACNKMTQEIGRIFCPKCGNGGTLRKVSVTVGENGIVMASRKHRVILRGTKFSLPLPQGGRDAVTKNLILREDQLPHKVLYPKQKKKANDQDEDSISSDDIFSSHGDKRVPLKPPVRKALSLFSGKRNPNDNHFSRRRC